MNIDIREIKTFYINLDKHTEKDLAVKNELEKLGIKNFTRVSGVDMPSNKQAGCASSHYNILASATSPLLILEDDCTIYKQILEIDIPDDADAVYLGLSRWGNKNNRSKVDNYSHYPVKGYKNIYRIDGMLATHAILYLSQEYIEISRRIAKYCANNSIHVDVGFTEIHKLYNVYAINQPLFYQSTNEKSTKMVLRGTRK